MEWRNTNLSEKFPFHKRVSLATHQDLMNWLGTLNSLKNQKHIQVLEKKKEISYSREQLWYVDASTYPIEQLKSQLREIVLSLWYPIDNADWIEVSFIDRKQFDWDVTIKVSKLLSMLWSEYWSRFIPALIEAINNNELLSKIVEKIEIKNRIYLNIKFKDSFLLDSVESVEMLWSLYGHNDSHRSDKVVIDYSSPNAAKRLHAWHIRSTVLWKILWNIYQANGYEVHWVNHVNDRGWFWVYLAGIKQRGEVLSKKWLKENELMVEIYKIYRLAQKCYSKETIYNNLEESDINLFSDLFWDITTFEKFQTNFDLFSIKANDLFQQLESWTEEIVKQWKEIVDWSLADFQSFYDAFDIHLDYLIWESFYADKWKHLVLDWVDKNEIVYFDSWEVERAIQEINSDETLNENERIKNRLLEEVVNDEWSYVIKLPNHERYVVMKKDGTSIYATRDLWAVNYRIETYDPKMMVYVVWQEQWDHFQKLFDSSKSLSYVGDVEMCHIPFWFYVNAKDKKKLSSREGAANVHFLIDESRKYYLNKYEWKDDFTEDEKLEIANNLAVWWIVFNDISKWRMQQVGINSDIQDTVKDFESKGGVYIIYTCCRAKSILSRYKKEWSESIEKPSIDGVLLSLQEIDLIKKLNSYPLIIKKASEKHEPTIVAQFLYDLSQSFNTFYNANQILKWWEAKMRRLWLTKQVIQTLENWCKICHLPMVDRI